MTAKHQKIIWIMGASVFVVFCVLIGYFIGIPMVRLAQTPELFREWVDSFGVWGKALFIGMVFLQVIVALIPGEPLELAAGYAFGIFEGMLLAMSGILLGSWVVFASVRFLGVKFVTIFFQEKEIKRLSFLKNPKKSFVLALVLMTIPGTPKDLLSYFAGLMPLTTFQWLGIVAFGRIPSVLTSVVTGAAAGEKNYTLALVTFTITLAASLLGIIFYRHFCNEQTANDSAP